MTACCFIILCFLLDIEHTRYTPGCCSAHTASGETRIITRFNPVLWSGHGSRNAACCPWSKLAATFPQPRIPPNPVIFKSCWQQKEFYRSSTFIVTDSGEKFFTQVFGWDVRKREETVGIFKLFNSFYFKFEATLLI